MTILNMIKLQLKLMFKSPTVILQFILLPTVLTAMIGYLTQDNFSKQISSYEYNSIGVMIFMYSGIGVISAFNFIEKDTKQGNIRLIFTPIRTIWIHASHMISGMLFGTITIAINMMTFRVLFNVNYNNNAFIIFLSFCAIAYISSAIGIYFSIIIDETLKIEEIFTVTQLVFCLLGGCFFSLEGVEGIPKIIANISPVKFFMDGILNSMYINNNAILIVLIPVSILLVIFITFMSICKFRTEKYI